MNAKKNKRERREEMGKYTKINDRITLKCDRREGEKRATNLPVKTIAMAFDSPIILSMCLTEHK